MAEKPIRLILVDDHALVRSGFRRILEDEPDIEVVAEAANGREAVDITAAVEAEVVVMDMAMPEVNGLQASAEILKRSPETRILVLSQYPDPQYVKNALDIGVKGYILKNAIDTDLTRAVRAVAAGEQYLSPELSGVLIRAIQSGSFAPEDPYEQLSEREKQVLQYIARGNSNREIAQLLGLSVNTVAVHRYNVMNRLKLHKTAELVLFAVKRGLIVPE
jgi:two-component system, NarL family, response regulator NreC